MSFLRQVALQVKGGPLLPGVSEPLTCKGSCLNYGGEGEGPLTGDLGKLLGRAIRQSAMGSVAIVIRTPSFEFLACIYQVEEHFSV